MNIYPNTEKLISLFNANRRELVFDNESDAAIVRDILLALKNATPELMAVVLSPLPHYTMLAPAATSTLNIAAARKSATKPKSK